jgi:hypothetical protein
MRSELAARTTAETDSARRAPALHAGCRARCRASAFRHALRHAGCIRWARARSGERVGASDSERVTQVSKEVAEATPLDFFLASSYSPPTIMSLKQLRSNSYCHSIC